MLRLPSNTGLFGGQLADERYYSTVIRGYILRNLRPTGKHVGTLGKVVKAVCRVVSHQQLKADSCQGKRLILIRPSPSG